MRESTNSIILYKKKKSEVYVESKVKKIRYILSDYKHTNTKNMEYLPDYLMPYLLISNYHNIFPFFFSSCGTSQVSYGPWKCDLR